MRYCPLCGDSTSALHCPEDGTPTVRRVATATGQVMRGEVIGGRYRVSGVIGRGGFGTVYEAQHVTTGHAVAVKLLTQRPGAEGDELARRFFKEAATTSRLSHPNTVRVFDFGQTEGGDLFIAMERLVGESLQELISSNHQQRKVMSEAQTVEVGVAVLRSLGEAHAHGLVHRDLKPGNIFLHQVAGGDSIVKVLDFGIVKDVDTSITQAGKALGTPTHMSPEQAMGKTVDARCDLYALGCVLFECLTGSLPYFADNPLAIVMQHVTEPVPSIESRVPGLVRPAVANVVERALAKEPEDRWADASAMRSALQQALSNPGMSAFPLDMRPRSLQHVQSSHLPGAMIPRKASPAPRITEPRSAPLAEAPEPPVSGHASAVSADFQPASAEDRTLVERPAMLDMPSGPIPILSHGRPLTSETYVPVAPRSSVASAKAGAAKSDTSVVAVPHSGGARPAPPTHTTPPPPPPVSAPVSIAPPSMLSPFSNANAPPVKVTEFTDRATVNLDALDAAELDRLRRGPAPIVHSSSDVPIPVSQSSEPSERLNTAGVAVAAMDEAPEAVIEAASMASAPEVDVRPPSAEAPPSTPKRFTSAPKSKPVASPPPASAPSTTTSTAASAAMGKLSSSLNPVVASAEPILLDEEPGLSIIGEEDVIVEPYENVVSPPRSMKPPPGARKFGGLGARGGLGVRGGLNRIAASMAGFGASMHPRNMQSQINQDLIRMTQDLRQRTQTRASSARSTVAAMWIAPDGKSVLYGDRAGQVRMLHNQSFTEEVTQLSDVADSIEVGRHDAMITALALSPSGRLVLTASMDGSLCAWSPADGKQLGSVDLGAMINAVGISVDGKLALVGCDDGTARIIDLPSLTERRRLRGHRDSVTCVAIAGSRRAVITAGQGGTIRTWDPVGGGARLTARGHRGAVGALSLDRRGKWVLSGGWDGKARVWSPRTGDTLHVIDAHKDVVAGVALDPTGAFFATVGDDRAARIWDLDSGDLVAERTDFQTGAKYVRFRSDGRCIYIGGWDGTVRRLSAVGPL